MITKEQVLSALNLIEKYRIQELEQIKIQENEKLKQFDVSIIKLGLRTREINGLFAQEFKTIADLLSLDCKDLRKFRGLGKKSIENINEALKNYGLKKHFITEW
jgi:DNA-directed RNA polymerase alpha subunit